jgi:glutathione peroxidase
MWMSSCVSVGMSLVVMSGSSALSGSASAVGTSGGSNFPSASYEVPMHAAQPADPKPADPTPAPTQPGDAGKPESKEPEKKDGASADPSSADPAYVLGFTLKDINGKDVDLAQYKGKVVMIVNVASRCGFTPQYEGLQKLYEAKRDEGLVILGFPANNFMSQEPGTDAEIREFCTSKYGVTFPMFSKISVKGSDQHPLYKKLSEQPAPIGGDPLWNFTKFIVDKHGKVAARFGSRAKPDDKDLIAKIDELLKAK